MIAHLEDVTGIDATCIQFHKSDKATLTQLSRFAYTASTLIHRYLIGASIAFLKWVYQASIMLHEHVIASSIQPHQCNQKAAAQNRDSFVQASRLRKKSHGHTSKLSHDSTTCSPMLRKRGSFAVTLIFIFLLTRQAESTVCRSCSWSGVEHWTKICAQR